jgi:ribose 5-phosphate isomerase B
LHWQATIWSPVEGGRESSSWRASFRRLRPDSGDSVDTRITARVARVAVGAAEKGFFSAVPARDVVVANKFPHVRAAPDRRLHGANGQRHNNANILVLGGRVIDANQARRWFHLAGRHVRGGRHQEGSTNCRPGQVYRRFTRVAGNGNVLNTDLTVPFLLSRDSGSVKSFSSPRFRGRFLRRRVAIIANLT